MSPPPPENRPPEFGGYGEAPIFETDTDVLPLELRYRSDPAKPERHGFIERARRMAFADYQRAIYETRALWRPVQ